MTRRISFSYMGLLALTGLTWAGVENHSTSALSFRLMIVTALTLKFIVIAFEFMELVRAHLLWRLMALGYVGVTAGVILQWLL